MPQLQYFYYYNGNIYKKSETLPVLECIDIDESYGFSSYENALYLLQECQNLIGKNSLSFNEDFLEENRTILDNVQILPSNDPLIVQLCR